MPIPAIRYTGQTIDGLPERDPVFKIVSGAWLAVGLARPRHRAVPGADNNRPTTSLGHTKVGCIEDVSLDQESKLFFRPPLESRILSGGKQLGNVLHHKDLRINLLKRTQILPPKTSALKSDSVSIKRREALAGRPTDYNVGGRKRRNILDQRL